MVQMIPLRLVEALNIEKRDKRREMVAFQWEGLALSSEVNNGFIPSFIMTVSLRNLGLSWVGEFTYCKMLTLNIPYCLLY
jgi:hypothetical protein